MKISVIVPFYNTPIENFKNCINSLKKVNAYEVILVDDCSSNKEVVKLAKNSGFKYIKTKKQSGSDGTPVNLGVKTAKGDYICRVDSDDMLLQLPQKFDTDICFGNIDRLGSAHNISLEKLILAPQAYCNALVARKDIFLKHPFATDKNVYSDILFLYQILYNDYTYSYFNKVNYIYCNTEGSILNSKSFLHQRLLNMQTVARFCQLEQVPQNLAVKYMTMAMKNFYYGSNSIKYLNEPMPLFKDLPQ
ncbi:glycosyltransferase, family 2 [Malaciobacter halophilus]|uniref:glycosyltransferase family 2 protein n=1 Tax=Malaciobacter halophilus TaxID=197482 RepID=UPI000E10C7BF|nr:glycosyltransferase family 2 protein [Malaciobacter halophilus]AXH09640.1 glycosyltransferase, family 2 [Malaciobacter halophilus]